LLGNLSYFPIPVIYKNKKTAKLNQSQQTPRFKSFPQCM